MMTAFGRAQEIVDLALAHLRGELGDLDFLLRVDADERDADPAAMIDDGGGFYRRRDVAGKPRPQRGHHRFRVFDAGAIVDVRHARHLHGAIFPVGRLRRCRAAIGLHRHMRHGVDELVQEIDLRALHQPGHHDGEADAHGDASHADQRLPHAGRDMGPGNVDEEVGGHSAHARSAAEFRNIAPRVVDDGIDVGRDRRRDHGIVRIGRGNPRAQTPMPS